MRTRTSLPGALGNGIFTVEFR
uniref:Uncharacterized protein n=1 Tax=Acrobeloides nanus TaxID=290746 RepID=A0A914CQE8_9BILA